jgi:hypothetical protein
MEESRSYGVATPSYASEPFMVHYQVVEDLYSFSQTLKMMNTTYIFDEAIAEKTWPYVKIPAGGMPSKQWMAYDYIFNAMNNRFTFRDLFSYTTSDGVAEDIPVTKADIIDFVDFFMIGKSTNQEENFRQLGLKVMDRLWAFGPVPSTVENHSKTKPSSKGADRSSSTSYHEHDFDDVHDHENPYGDDGFHGWYDEDDDQDEDEEPKRQWYSAEQTAVYDLMDGACGGKGNRKHLQTMVKRAAKNVIGYDEY